ncbi:hypothetical protein AVEN_35533-1 [Araneus ventricosus]|uniref:Uncharacterized protein n=1 Tax=Araneus ventricosus TaxID=182803 RepID=A0A4Y2HLN0_ARAVE|nr:hypothetical protein AVEN_35533-1 [Araneus ventricosus]
MQDGAPPHFHHKVRQYLNDTIPGRWIGRGEQYDFVCLKWPLRSQDLTPCDFYIWGYIKDRVYVAPIPATLQGLRDRIVTAVSSITRQQIDKQFDNCRITNGAHIECIK